MLLSLQNQSKVFNSLVFSRIMFLNRRKEFQNRNELIFLFTDTKKKQFLNYIQIEGNIYNTLCTTNRTENFREKKETKQNKNEAQKIQLLY